MEKQQMQMQKAQAHKDRQRAKQRNKRKRDAESQSSSDACAISQSKRTQAMDALDLPHPLSSSQDAPPKPVGVPAPAGPARPRAPATLPRGPTARAPALARPVEVSCLIFSFAPVDSFGSIALVCKAWARLVVQVLRLNKWKAEQYVQQGLVCMKTSNCPWDSLRLFSRAITVYPRLIEAYFWGAKALFILNYGAAAVQVLQGALRQQPSAVEALKLRACVLYANDNNQCASRLLEDALALAPHDASIHFELGFCYQGLQQFERAIECYSNALRLNYHRTFVVLSNRANCLFGNNRVAEALQDLKASLQISPHYHLALRLRADVNRYLGDEPAAYQDYTTIIEHATDAKVKSDAYSSRAFCYGFMDEDDIERARAVDPTNFEPVQCKAKALVGDGRVAAAIDHVTQWMASNETHKDLARHCVFRGELYAIVFDWEASTRDYEQALATLKRTLLQKSEALLR